MIDYRNGKGVDIVTMSGVKRVHDFDGDVFIQFNEDTNGNHIGTILTVKEAEDMILSLTKAIEIAKKSRWYKEES